MTNHNVSRKFSMTRFSLRKRIFSSLSGAKEPLLATATIPA